MKRILSAIAIAMFVIIYFCQPAFAATEGAKIFNNNCASCHAGGKNNVVAAKNLQAAALEKYGKNSIEAITLQVTKGKGAMPGFGKKLSADEINLVATYVLEQAKNGWTKG